MLRSNSRLKAASDAFSAGGLATGLPILINEIGETAAGPRGRSAEEVERVNTGVVAAVAAAMRNRRQGPKVCKSVASPVERSPPAGSEEIGFPAGQERESIDVTSLKERRRAVRRRL